MSHLNILPVIKVLTSYRFNIAKLHLNLKFEPYILLVHLRLHMVLIGSTKFCHVF